VSNANFSFIGTLSEDGILFKVKRQLVRGEGKVGLGGMLQFISTILRWGKRIDAEAGRRGQPVPAVRLPS
jgi:hypothetical protein